MAVFVPPTADLLPPVVAHRDPGNALFRHYKNRAQGMSVLKIDGVYQTIVTPSQEQIDAASEVYLGGHFYEVSASVASALTAAGYSVS